MHVTVTPTFEQSGSINADDIESHLVGVDTQLHVEAAADRKDIARLIATAERMCFMMNVIREPHELRAQTWLNGEPLDTGSSE